MKMYPLIFNGIYKQYIWGGAGFEKLNKRPPDNFAAESWELSCHKDGMSVVAEGFLKGKTLKELVSIYGLGILGKRGENSDNNFPLLVKFINAKNKLSVQVHPDDAYAIENEGEHGKNEAWVILDAEEGAELIIGIKEGVDKSYFQKAIAKKTVETCLNKIKVKAGDVFNIPAGLIHAIGKGIMLAEIQQNSNTTYRIFDYNRKDDSGSFRPLQIDKALEVIDFDQRHKNEKANGIKVKIGNESSRTITVANKYFCLESFDIKEEIKQKASGETFLIYVFTEGIGSIIYDNDIINVKKGDSYLIPAEMGDFIISGCLKYIKSYIPDISKDIIKPLVGMGYGVNYIYENIEGVRGNK